jgi:hypothetical protein
MAALQVLVQAVFEGQDLLDVQVVHIALVHGIQRGGHQADGQRAVLGLLEQFGHAGAAVELLARGRVQVGGELREGGQFAVLRQVGTDAAGQALDELGLRRTADPRHRDTGVDGGADAGVEEVGFQEDLAVGDRDHVGGHEGRHVTGLGFDDGQRRQRTGLALDFALGEGLDVVGVDARGTLQQAAVQVEHVAGVGFAARRAAQQQRDLAVGHGLLGQIVIDDQRVLPAVAEVLAHGAARVGADVLHGGRFGSRGGDDDGVVHRAVLFQRAHDVLDRAGLLPDRDVHAGHVLTLLVDDGVDRHGGLAGLAVADDQLALAAADGHHGVDGLQAGLHRLVHALAGDHARGDLLDHVGHLGVDRALAVDGLAQRVDDAADQLGADGHRQDLARALDGVAFGDVFVLTQDHGADGVAFQVQRQAVGRLAAGGGGELEHFAGHHVGQAVHTHDAVGDGHHRALVLDVARAGQALDAALDQLGNFCGIEVHGVLRKWLRAATATAVVTRSARPSSVRDGRAPRCPAPRRPRRHGCHRSVRARLRHGR